MLATWFQKYYFKVPWQITSIHLHMPLKIKTTCWAHKYTWAHSMCTLQLYVGSFSVFLSSFTIEDVYLMFGNSFLIKYYLYVCCNHLYIRDNNEIKLSYNNVNYMKNYFKFKNKLIFFQIKNDTLKCKFLHQIKSQGWSTNATSSNWLDN